MTQLAFHQAQKCSAYVLAVGILYLSNGRCVCLACQEEFDPNEDVVDA
jgi:hypothetical protein